METMRRHAAAIIVAFLATCVSSIPAVTVADPCTASERTGTDHVVAPDTCVGCGCCAEIAEPGIPVLSCSPDSALPTGAASLSRIPRMNPRDILHVPKPRLS